MNKALILIVSVLFIFEILCPLSAWSAPYYIPGIVVSTAAPNQITIGSKTYAITPGSEIMIQLRKGPSIYEQRAKFSDIHPGDSVYVKIEASSILHVLIERWK